MEAAAQMTVEAFYGRENGLRVGGMPYLTVCREQDAPPETISTDCQPKATTRADGRTTAEVMTEIAHRWNSYAAMLAALERVMRVREALPAEGWYKIGEATIAEIREALIVARGEVK